MKYSAEEILSSGSSYFPTLADEFYSFSKRWMPDKKYYGVFADEPIVEGSVIARGGGKLVGFDHISEKEMNFSVLMGEGIYAVPIDMNNLETFWFVNHSCSPNVARIGGLIFVAKKAIQAGDEITIDYAPLAASISEKEKWSMECNCASENCRRIISSEDWKNPSLVSRLWPEWLPFIQKLIVNNSHIG
ncbi:MAG: SET domain-containing protein [Oligoflexales bacterium]|nr:SET domain-containing protein [Oligoflexales bacterium]